MIQKKKIILYFNINFSILKVRNKGESMTREDLKKYKVFLESLNEKEKEERLVHLSELAAGKKQGPMTGYPSIDKVSLKYYTEEQIRHKIPKKNIYQALKDYNRNRMKTIALDYGPISVTYEEMFKKIDEVANSLTAMGIKKGDRIASTFPSIPEIVYLAYGAAKIGAILETIDTLTPPYLLIKYCKRSNPKLIFALDATSDMALDNIKKCGYSKVISASPVESLNMKESEPIDKKYKNNPNYLTWKNFVKKGKNVKSKDIPYEKDMPFAILHTSGSTGIPKGALISHDNMNALASQTINSPLDMQPGEKALDVMPPFALYGLGNGIHVHLCAGMRVRLIPSYEPNKFGEQILKYKPNRFACSPAHIEELVNDPSIQDADLSFIRHPIEAGDRLRNTTEISIDNILLRNGCKDRLAKTYGLTESCAGVCICVNNETNKFQSAGIPLTKTTIAIFDPKDHNKELLYNQEGEIAIYSPNNMLEYIKSKKETNKTLKKHEDGTVWLHTGDIGKIDTDGVVHVYGRAKKTIIQYIGVKLHPFEVESVLTHPLIKKAVVAGVRDREHDRGELPVAFLEIDSSSLQYENELKQYLLNTCRQKLDYYKVPVDYVFLEHIPTTNRGKTDYNKLVDDYEKIAENREIIKQRILKIS